MEESQIQILRRKLTKTTMTNADTPREAVAWKAVRLARAGVNTANRQAVE